MKNNILLTCILCVILHFATASKASCATTYNIDHFSDGPLPQNALINRGAYPFATGDTLNFTNVSTMNATSSIGDIGPSSTSLTLNGNSKTIDGSSLYAGFSIVAGDTYTFNSIYLDHFKNNNGGAIYDNQGTITVNGCHFTGDTSTASIGGGAIYSTATATTTIINSLFNNNSATASTGGGAFYGRGQVTISGSTFTSNGINAAGTIITGKGGAVYNDARAGTTTTLTNNNFYSNIAADGGAIFNSPNSSSTVTTNISGGIFQNNTATNFGGAIYNSTGKTNISGVTFTSNGSNTIGSTSYTTLEGGAIYNVSDQNLTIDSSQFKSNLATKGGAIYDTTSGLTTITNSSFESNKATSGGAIYINGPINISGGSFTTNTATTSGGAIYNDGTTTLSNSPTFTSNSVTTGNGGAIYNTTGETINLDTANFVTNKATSGFGGAVYNLGTVSNSSGIYSGNSAFSGGAIFNDSSGIINSLSATFGGTAVADGNSASNSGGAIYNLGSISTSGGSFQNNTATNGGAIYNNGATTLTSNTAFISNSATTGGAIYNDTGKTIDLDTAKFTTNKAANFGGAVYNLGTITSSSGIYSGNSAFSGGAIFNDSSGIISSISGTFGGSALADGNSASNSGGAIYNSGKIVTLGGSFTNNTATNGGALYNNGIITSALTGAAFTSNSATTGGAIYNDTGKTIDLGNAGFTTNKAANFGGAVYNLGTITSSSGTYSGNSAFSGGAIFNDSSGWIKSIALTTPTDGNSASNSGGAIYNSGRIDTIGGTFQNNTATNGGALYNNGVITNPLSTGTTFTSNSATKGGAIYNDTSKTIDLGNASFTNNKATGGFGGALYNLGTVTNGSGTYSGNSASSGGAIYNDTGSALTLAGSSFSNNTASSNGGGIYNKGTATITNSTFSNNTASSGGAIYNSGTLNIKATAGNSTTFSTTADTLYLATGTVNLDADNTGTITFNGAIGSSSNANALNINSSSPTGIVNFNNAVTNSGINVQNGTVNFGENISLANDKLNISGGTSNFINQNLNTSNPIILSGGVMNLNSGNGGSSYVTDTISGAGTININKTVGSNPTGGTVNVNNNITGGATINMYNGTMALSNESYINGNNLGIYGGTLNTQNGLIGTMALNNLAFGGNANWLIDVDLANIIADKITSSNPATGSGTLNISNINLWSDASALSTSVIVADGNAKGHVSTSVSSINSALFTYAVSYNGSGTNGVLNFLKTGVSPNAITSDVSQTQTFLLQTAIDRQFFGNVDAFMSFPLAARESTICCAMAHDPTSGYTGGACPLSGNGTFSPIYSCDLNKGIWVKDFVSFENIPLINGPNVSTVEYGTLIGADAPLKYLGHGIVGNTSAYVGYLGSNQNYDSVGVSQNGALVGLAENMVYKNTFLTLMASVGSSLGNSINKWGTDNFSSLFAGLAAKGGYNFEFKEGEYIIQPNLMLAYTFTNTPDYQTASGLNMSSKPLNAIQIAPGVRLIKNLRQEKGQVYLVANWVYNAMDNTKFTANDVQLPELSIAPYIEYGIGFQRVWKERFTGFFQTLFRGGGRNGVAFQFGLRWAI